MTMQTAVAALVAQAAAAAGLPEGRVYGRAERDSIALPRPRLELAWTQEDYVRTGRKLGHIPGAWPALGLKKELYQVKTELLVTILSPDPPWLAAFAPMFLAALPRGTDIDGNWARLRPQRADLPSPAETRVDETSVKVFDAVSQLVVIAVTWLITAMEAQQRLSKITLSPAKLQHPISNIERRAAMADKKSPKTAPATNGGGPPETSRRNEAAEAPVEAPVEVAEPGAEALESLDELARLERAPSWLHAAALRFKGWQPGKTACRQEYRKALDALTQRRQGGGFGSEKE